MRFRKDVTMTSGLLLTAAAGPVSNLVCAMVCAGALHLLDLLPDAGHRQPIEGLLTISTRINLALAIFNLLPFPPLDGSRIVDGLMPFSWRGVWDRIARASAAVLVALVLLPQLFGFGIAQWVEALSSRLIGR